MKKFTLILIPSLFFTLAFIPLKAQILFNNGAQVQINKGIHVQVNGGFQDDNAVAGPGTVTNEGDVTVTSKGSWPGNIFISNTAVLQGDGQYHLEQDWINDATFTAGKSLVEMYGNTRELITSNNGTVTTFDTLELDGTGTGMNRRKQQTLDAKVAGALLLTDRVLFTAGHTMYVTTPNLTAVTNNTTFGSEGFVSSILKGSLSRVTNSASAYYFPVGADSVVTRYRKVLLTPASANANTYTVRLANNDATLDGDPITALDTALCNVNPLFYHKINHTAGTDNADIDIFYDPVADGAWTQMAQWNTPTAAIWNSLGAVTYTPGSPYSDVLKKNWGDFSNDPFILGNHKPSPPALTCNPYCQGSTGTFTAVGDSGGYAWTVPAGDSIVSGAGTGTIVVSGDSTGPITVVNTLTGCSSSAASCSITILPSPTADFTGSSTGMFNNTWSFTDLSTANISSWAWTFGDGGNSTMPDPGHVYPAGTYVVTETVTNSSGCSASKTETIVVPEGIFIPNVFTPNGDGQNDVFGITASGLKFFSIEIYNRWGEKVFTSTSPMISWDGRTSAGVMASDGTYYYILKATSESGKDWSKRGYLELIR